METTATATATATGVLDYFLPLGFVSTYGRIFQIFRDRWIAFTGIAFVMYAVGWIFSILLSLVWGNDIRIVGFSSIYGYAFEFMWDIYGYAFYHYAYELEVGSNLAFYFVEVALYYVFAGFAHGALVLLTMHWYVHQSQHPIDAFESALRKCWSIVGATALISLIVILPALLPAVTLWVFAGVVSESTVVDISILLIVMWVVWSICISIVTSTVYAAIMAEGMGPWASIQRSFSLGQGQWDSIVGILVPLWVLQVWSKAVLGKLIVYFSIIGDQIVVTNVLATIIGILLLAVAPV